MAFASKFAGMVYFASSLALAALASGTGCVATSPVEFDSAENYPPSVVSEPTAEYPLNRIGELDLDEPVESPELRLEVVVRDPNLDQTLDFRMFLDSPPEPEIPFTDGEILPSGFVERPKILFVSYDLLTPGECHRIEHDETRAFASDVAPRRPAEARDVDEATWCVEATDTDNPVITENCR